MAKGQKPARVVPADEQDSVTGKPQDLIIHGSRLAQHMGEGAAAGHPEPNREKEIEPSRVAAMKQGKRLVQTFNWPGADWKAGVVVLTEEELQEAAIWASERLKDAQEVMDGATFLEHVEIEGRVQILWRALVDPETMLPVATSPGELRKWCTRDEINYLVDQFNDHQQRVSPLSSPQIGDEEARAIISALKKAPEETELGGLDAASLRLLLRLMAAESDASPSNNS